MYLVLLLVLYLFCATSWPKCTGHSKVVKFPQRSGHMTRGAIKLFTNLTEGRNTVGNVATLALVLNLKIMNCLLDNSFIFILNLLNLKTAWWLCE